MLYHLLTPLADEFQLFNVFRYLTFRTGGAVMTALIISFLLGPSLIRWMRSLTMEERLRWLQDSANALSMIRDGLTHTRPH